MKKSAAVFSAILLMGTINCSFAKDLRQIVTPNQPSTLSVGQSKEWSDWSTCRKAASEGVATAVAMWQSQAVLTDVVINGADATGGIVSGPELQPVIGQAMVRAGVPSVVANGFASSVSKAWNLWTSTLKAPGSNWYPAFACFPGPAASSTANVPTPLAGLGGNLTALTAVQLKASIKQAIGAQANTPEATAAIEAFADDFATHFLSYRSSVMVRNVMGTGAVPSYAPPHVNCGPVVNGKGSMSPGGFVGSWP